MISLEFFALIFIPMVIVIGIAASTISFTSWSLVVPLLFGGFGFSIFDTLFFAIIIDLINGIILTYRYGKIKQVDYKLALSASIPMLFGAFIGFFFFEQAIVSNSEAFKGGMGYLVILISLIFILKGKRDSKNTINEEIPHKTLPNLPQISQNSPSSIILPKKVSIFLLIIGVIISGGLGGAMGVGSGMNYAFLFMIFLGYDLRRATGTSSLMMALVMLAALFMFLPQVDIPLIWPYLLIGIIFSFIGTNLGLKYTLQLPQAKLNYMVGGALLIAGVIAIIQAVVI